MPWPVKAVPSEAESDLDDDNCKNKGCNHLLWLLGMSWILMEFNSSHKSKGNKQVIPPELPHDSPPNVASGVYGNERNKKRQGSQADNYRASVLVSMSWRRSLFHFLYWTMNRRKSKLIVALPWVAGCECINTERGWIFPGRSTQCPPPFEVHLDFEGGKNSRAEWYPLHYQR